MTAPRQILPGTTYLVTRRCAQRRLLLRPSPLTNQLCGYLLAVAARRIGIRVHAFCVLSNHFHLVVTDPEARLPAFGQYLDSLLARALNASLGRWEAFWAPHSYSAVSLVGPRDVVDKTAYVLANPVEAGLVPRARRWPGLWSAPEALGGESRTFQRPDHFFRAGGRMPASAELALVLPPGFTSVEDFRRQVEAALESREGIAAGASGRRGFVGVARVLSQDPERRAGAREARRGLIPRVACQDRWRRLEVLRRLVEFVRSYRRARRSFLAGLRGVVFPAGTYLLRVTHGVACTATA